MISKPPCLAAALDYLERGWSALALCPHDHVGVGKAHALSCGSPGKVPMGPWAIYQKRLPKPDEIEAQWHQQPNANIGLVLGSVSGMVGIDVDGSKGEELLQKVSGGNLPDTLEFVTPGGGRRLLYAVPKDHPLPITKIAGTKHQELRVLANGSQTVAPPSRHKSGGMYQWVDGKSPWERNIAPAPKWLLTRLALKAAQAAHATTNGVHAAPAQVIPEGQRDVTLTSMAGAMRRRGVSEEGIYAALCVENKRCVPPLAEPQLRKIAKSVAKYQPHQVNEQTMARAAHTVRLDSVQTKAYHFLWKPWLCYGKVAVLDGDPGLGKSTVTLDLAARLTRGLAMPDGQPAEKHPVAIMSAEDDADDTIRPRLEAAGADVSMVHLLESVKEQSGDRPYAIPADLDLIEQQIVSTGSRLLIVDPLMAFLVGVDACKDQDVRVALHRIKQMASRTRCAVFLQRHMNKSGGTKALYRGGGSIGIIAASRFAMIIAADPDSQQHRVLACNKTNVSAMPPSLRYSLEPLPTGVCRVAWCGESPHAADDLVAPPPGEDEKLAMEDAIAFLNSVLPGAPMEAKHCVAEAKALGIAQRTLERAKAKLGVKSERINTEHGPRWFWKLNEE